MTWLPAKLDILMDEHELIKTRFWLVVVSGGLLALFGILANALLTRLFLTSQHFRHSPFFFLGFVALFDTLLDAVYIFLLIPPVLSEYCQIVRFYLLWLQHVRWLYMLGQIFKLSSVFCLIVASFERYLVTSHWTFGGFEERNRWLLLALVLTLAIAIRYGTTVDIVVLVDGRQSDPFKRYSAGQLSRREWLPNFLNLLTVIVPFGTLIFLNGGIVLMLRQQNVQQLRSLITELTMGYDFMKIRRRNIRAATNTLLLIISAYLISNLLSLFLSISVFLRPGLLQRQYPIEYRLCSDGASLLTLIGNALRFPAHFCSNAEVREQCKAMFYPEIMKRPTIGASAYEVQPAKNIDVNCCSKTLLSTLQLRRYSERLENPWFSALLTARPSIPAVSEATRRISRVGQVLLEGRNKDRGSNCAKGKEELEAYLRGKTKGIKRRELRPSVEKAEMKAGHCAVCNGQLAEGGGCCSGGAIGTEREPLFEELFGDGREERRKNEGKMRREEDDDEEQKWTESEEEEESDDGSQIDFSQLRFDPAEFATLAMAI